MPIILGPTEERILDFLMQRKRPVSIDAVMKQFIISRSNASITLNRLHERGLLDVVKMGSKKFFKIKD